MGLDQNLFLNSKEDGELILHMFIQVRKLDYIWWGFGVFRKFSNQVRYLEGSSSDFKQPKVFLKNTVIDSVVDPNYTEQLSSLALGYYMP